MYTEWFKRKVLYFERWKCRSLWEKIFMWTCVDMNDYRDTTEWNYRYKSTVNCIKVTETTYCYFNSNFNLMLKWQICYTEMTDLLQLTINIRKSHCLLQWKSCAKIACYSSELIFTFLNAGSSTQTASKQFVSCIHFSFVNFALHHTPQTKI